MKKTNLFLTGIIFTTLTIQLLIHKAQAQVCFSPATNFAVGSSGPHSIVNADFNGDSKTDLAVSTWGGNSVSVQLGDGLGGFGVATNFPAGMTPTSVIYADFNSDSKADLAVTNNGSNNVSVLLGDGAGNFSPATDFFLGSNSYSGISADFNGDSKADLAVANYSSGTVSVLLGDGTGSFGAAANFTVGTNPTSIVNKDFNGDGKSDLVTANYGSGNVSVLLGDGTGNFGSATNFVVGPTPYSICSGDFNADSKADLALANANNNNVSVLLGNGLGSFNAATNFNAGNVPYSITNGDFNEDGKVDLAIANQNSNNVSVLLGNGFGNFSSAINLTVGSCPSSIIGADFNGDGQIDLAVANKCANNTSILLNEIPKVTVQASATTVCSGTLVTLTGGGANTYTWTGGVIDGVMFTVPSSTTTYTVTGTAVGCLISKTATKTITVNPRPISSAGNDLTICSGIVGNIGAIAIAGNTYSWSPSTGLSDTTFSNPANTTINSTSTPIVTTYTVTTTITATGCQSIDTSIIIINPQPVLSITNPSAVCFPNTVDITAGAVTAGSTAVGILSYWTDSGATSSLSSPNAIATSGTNYIKVTANGGCIDIKPVTDTVNPLPISNAGNDLTLCSGISANIGASAIVGNTYSWNPSTGLTDTTVSNPANTTINNTSTPIVTTYTVTTTITVTGCQSTDTSIIIISPQPLLSITNPSAVCFPNTVDITAGAVTAGSTGGGILSYWNDAGATSSLSSPNAIATSGTNYIKVTANGGCTDIKPVTDSVNPQPIATFMTQDESSSLYCDGLIKASLTGGTGTIQSQWVDFAQTVLSTSDSVSALCPGTVTLNLTDAISCTNSYTLVIQAGPTPPTPQICLVTVDSTFTHNLIVWEKTNLNMIGIDSFVVYREIGTNTYHAIGTVFHDSLSTFDDLGANPSTTGYRYKLKSKNAHGVLSLFSDFHNTIYLTNTGGNFSWTPYQVENITTPVFTYNVYRDDNSTGNFQTIGNTTGNQFGYTDINFSSFPFASYYVEAVMTSGVCSPTRSGITAAKSNVKHFGTTGVQQLSINTAIKIYPNPASSTLNITGITGKTLVRLYDVVGQLVIEKEVENNYTINTSQITDGIYSLLMESKTGRIFNKVVISH